MIDEDSNYLCPTCDGSGEGMYDGSTCRRCGGSGEISCISKEELEADAADHYWQMKKDAEYEAQDVRDFECCR